jgi:hypothetical protein
MATGCSYKIYQYGGVYILVKHIVLYQVVLHNTCTEKMFEECDIIIQINTIRDCILCLCRVPVENINHFIEQLNIWALKYLEHANSKLILCGDTKI